MKSVLKKNIQKFLSFHKMSVTELEKKANLKQSAVSNILHDRSKNPGIETLKAIAGQFGCNVDSLLEDSSDDFLNENIESQHKKQSIDFSLIKKAFIELEKAIENKSLSKNIAIEQFLTLIEKIYKYSVMGNINFIDKRYVNWLIDNM